MSLAEQKAEARRQAYAARKAAHAAGQGSAADHLAAVLAPHAGKVLAGYLPIRTEIDPRPAMADYRGPVCVPVIAGPDRPLAFRAWRPETPLIAGAFGAPIPAAGDWLEPEVLIVPLVAFDARLCRLGYGGGYYDRTLALLRARRPTLAVGFAYAAQELPGLPLEPTDQPLDLIVTEAGVRRAGG